MAKPKRPTKKPAVLDQFAADLHIAATGPRTITIRLHGREQTISTTAMRRQMRLLMPAIEWIVEHIEAKCAEADRLRGRPRV